MPAPFEKEASRAMEAMTKRSLNQCVTPLFLRKSQMKFQVSPAPGCAGSYRKATWVSSPMILVCNPDRAMTVVDEINGDSICDQIPLPHFITAHYSSFRLAPPPAAPDRTGKKLRFPLQ